MNSDKRRFAVSEAEQTWSQTHDFQKWLETFFKAKDEIIYQQSVNEFKGQTQLAA